MLYSAGQLIGKTLVLNHSVNVYKVVDINELGDSAKPTRTMKQGDSFTVDSFLSPTSGYTSSYGIKYAKRSNPYFTFYAGNSYEGIAIISDGRFSIKSLTAQGALNVKEEVAAQTETEKEGTISGFFDNIKGFFGVIFKNIIPILIIIAVIVAIIYLSPLLTKKDATTSK